MAIRLALNAFERKRWYASCSRKRSPEEISTSPLLIIVVAVLRLGGGGLYGRAAGIKGC
jgi:hypothetical protein